jgi:hypothetical protein
VIAAPDHEQLAAKRETRCAPHFGIRKDLKPVPGHYLFFAQPLTASERTLFGIGQGDTALRMPGCSGPRNVGWPVTLPELGPSYPPVDRR